MIQQSKSIIQRANLLLFILPILGCGLTSQSAAPTIPAAITATPLGEGPALPDLYPLSSGAVWTYHATTDIDDGSGPQHWEGSITETAVETTLVGDQEVYHVQLAGHPTRTTPDQTDAYYVPFRDRLYSVPTSDDAARLIATDGGGYETAQILAWPLEVDQAWGDPQMMNREDRQYVWRVEAIESVDTLAGHFDGCYHLAFRTNPDDTQRWFCPGTGFVRYEYHHHGSLNNEVWELASFSAPAP